MVAVRRWTHLSPTMRSWALSANSGVFVNVQKSESLIKQMCYPSHPFSLRSAPSVPSHPPSSQRSDWNRPVGKLRFFSGTITSKWEVVSWHNVSWGGQTASQCSHKLSLLSYYFQGLPPPPQITRQRIRGCEAASSHDATYGYVRQITPFVSPAHQGAGFILHSPATGGWWMKNESHGSGKTTTFEGQKKETMWKIWCDVYPPVGKNLVWCFKSTCW